MSFLGDMSRDRKKWACTVQTLWTQTMKHKTNGVSTIEFSKSGKKLSQLLHTTCCTCCFLIWKRRSIPKIPRQTLQSRFFCWFTMMWTLWHTAKHLFLKFLGHLDHCDASPEDVFDATSYKSLEGVHYSFPRSDVGRVPLTAIFVRISLRRCWLVYRTYLLSSQYSNKISW